MEKFLFEGRELYFVLIAIFILILTKIFLFNSVRSRYWKISHFLFFSFTNIRTTHDNFRFSVKILSNFLTISILLVTCSFLFSLYVINKSSENQEESTITEVLPGETKSHGAFQTVYVNQPDTTNISFVKKSDNIRDSQQEDKKEDSLVDITENIPIKKALEKKFTAAEMFSILEMLNAKREKAGIKSNSVKIIKTKASNVSNAMELAKFLQKNGFVIAGREVKLMSVKGSTIDVEGKLFKIIVGNY